jgi:hypothetical protein
MGNSGQIWSEKMSTKTEIFEIDSWRLVGCFVASVLVYGSVWYSGIAMTHMLWLERVQFRGIRKALAGLMCLIPHNSLNFRYLVVVSYRLDHPLKRRLKTLKELNMDRCITGVIPMFCHCCFYTT